MRGDAREDVLALQAWPLTSWHVLTLDWRSSCSSNTQAAQERHATLCETDCGWYRRDWLLSRDGTHGRHGNQTLTPPFDSFPQEEHVASERACDHHEERPVSMGGGGPGSAEKLHGIWQKCQFLETPRLCEMCNFRPRLSVASPRWPRPWLNMVVTLRNQHSPARLYFSV